MKKIILLILLIGCFTSCSKEEEKPPLKGEDKPIIIKEGHGALFFGATKKTMYHLKARNKESNKVWTSQVLGEPSTKSPVGCVLKDPNIMVLMLPPGEYELEIIDEPATSAPWITNVVIEENNCVAINATGFAW